MSCLDAARHPVLCQVAQGAQWLGTDAFPSCTMWADEYEAWLRFVTNEGVLDHYRPRLQGSKERCEEAIAEIAVAYFFVRRCGLWILAWEPPGAGQTCGEFLLSADAAPPVFVEVKAPGWEQEIVQSEGRANPRLKRPKYVDEEARATGPWASVRHAVAKAYPKLPAFLPGLLVIADDLFVPLADWELNVKIGLYSARAQGHTSGYLAEDGSCVDARHERLGAVGVFKVDLA